MPIMDSGICEYGPCSKTYRGKRTRKKQRRFCSLECANAWQAEKFALLEIDTRKYPIFTHYPRLKGDWMLSADYHNPYVDVAFLQKMFAVAQINKIKKLGVFGDFFNQGAFSSWKDLDTKTEFEKELITCERELNLMLGWFEEIWFLTAGHEKRMLRLLGNNLEPKRMFRTITDRIGAEVNVSPYSHCLINNQWKIIHPQKGRKKKLSLASEMATKYHKHIVCFHQHYTALGFDVSGKYVVCDLGAMVDTRKLPYTQIDASVWPMTNKSFAMIKGDVLRIYTDHPNLTDWREILKRDALPKK